MRQLVGASLRFLSRMIQTPLHGARQARAKLTDSKAETKQRESGAALRSMPGITISMSPVGLPVECTNPYELDNALETFVNYPRSFTLDEFTGWLDADVIRDEARRSLLDDPRFIYLRSEMPEEHFIPEATLFRWWSYLTLRLARAQQARLTESKLAALMNSLRLDGKWDTPPDAAMSFGRRFGFVGSAWTPSQYVFSLARLLSYLSPGLMQAAMNVLKNLANYPKQGFAWKEMLDKSVEEGFARFHNRVAQVVMQREGLQAEGKLTLEQIGKPVGLTRERVRQIEAKFWDRLWRHPQHFSRPFVNAFLCDVMSRRGCLIIAEDSPDAPLRRFLAKCVGVPCTEVPHLGLAILGASSADVATLQSSWQSSNEAAFEAIASRIEADARLLLSEKDVKVLAERIVQQGLEHLNKAQRVYLSLQHIGRPAHYSKIAEVYNALFPDDPSTEHNIHAVLGRERHGVVWIGTRGMYALEEWGYDRPSKGLFEAVTEIVNNIYKETGKPVPFSVIVAEIGKYRQVVRPNSLVCAIFLNSGLRRVSKDCFVSRESGDELQEELAADELDRTLREFERQGDR